MNLDKGRSNRRAESYQPILVLVWISSTIAMFVKNLVISVFSIGIGRLCKSYYSICVSGADRGTLRKLSKFRERLTPLRRTLTVFVSILLNAKQFWSSTSNLPSGWKERLANLVDPASCHMLVSRTKPCKCKWTRFIGGTVYGSLNG